MKPCASTAASVREPVCRLEKIEVLKDAIPTLNTVKFLSLVCLSLSCCSSSALSRPPPPSIMATPPVRLWLPGSYLGLRLPSELPFSCISAPCWTSNSIGLSHGCPIDRLCRVEFIFSNPLLTAPSLGVVFPPSPHTGSQAHSLLPALSPPHTCLSLPCDDIS